MKTLSEISKIHLGILATLSLALLTSAPAKAQILDQSQEDAAGSSFDIVGQPIFSTSFYFPHGISFAQSFTVGITGQLTSMSVPLFVDPDAQQEIDYYLLPVNNYGHPVQDNAQALASGTVNLVGVNAQLTSGMDGWSTISLTTPINVTSGEKLALELTSNGGNPPDYNAWFLSSGGNPYNRGTAFFRDSTESDVPQYSYWSPTIDGDATTQPDFGFADFVIPAAAPEPRVTAVAAAAIALLALWRSRRRKALAVRVSDS